MSFEECFREHYPRLVALGAATTGDRELGRELAQEAFARLHARWAAVGNYDNPGAWLRRVMSNLVIDHHRSKASEKRAIGRLTSRQTTVASPDVTQADPWAELVAALPPRQRLIVTLYYGDDLPVAEIASLLDISANTVKSALSKARDTLRARLETQEHPHA